MSIKTEKLQKEMQEKITIILMRDSKNELLKEVMITDVNLAPDLSYAKVFYTTYSDQKEEIQKALEQSTSFIRTKLTSMMDIRHTPRLEFSYDAVFENALKMEKLLNEIKEK